VLAYEVELLFCLSFFFVALVYFDEPGSFYSSCDCVVIVVCCCCLLLYPITMVGIVAVVAVSVPITIVA
jgi:hypothetical protein